MKKSLFILFIFCLPNLVLGQEGKIKNNKVQKIKECESEYPELHPVFSVHGDRLYFTRIGHPENRYGAKSQDIWEMKKNDFGEWSELVRLPETVNITQNNLLIGWIDEQTAIIKGVFNKKGNRWKRRGISKVNYNSGGWGSPVEVKLKGKHKIDGNHITGSISPNGKYLFLSMGGAYKGKKQQLYVAERKNQKLAFKRLKRVKGIPWNIDVRRPILSKDEKTLYFSMFDETQQMYKLMSSTKEEKKSWTTPVMLGDTVNTIGANEIGFAIDPTYQQIVITSDKNGNYDLYQYFIEPPEFFVPITGNIINSKTNQVLVGEEITILNGQNLADSVTFDKTTGAYTMYLKAGATYNIGAKSVDHEGPKETIDLTQVNTDTTISQDLLIKPIDYVLLEGRVVDLQTDERADLEDSNLVADGRIVESYKSGENGTFTAKLPYGKIYQLNIVKYGYFGRDKMLDLRSINAYRKMESILMIEKIVGAKISGFLINEKTNEKITNTVNPKIFVDGAELPSAKINQATGAYEITLPFGKLYDVEAQLENHFPRTEKIDLRFQKENIKLLKDLYLTEAEAGQAVKLDNILFESAKATLKPISYFELGKVVVFMENNPKLNIEIAGHTDSDGSEALNERLSQKRADAVKSYLVSKGIDVNRIASKGYGETRPIASNETKEGKAKNRRVEFKVL